MVVLYILLCAVALLLAVLVVRTFMFRPKKELVPQLPEVNFDEQKAVDNLVKMIRCKTVSSRNPEMVDEGEFEKFRNLLKALYPNVHKTCKLERISNTGLLYFWKGRQAAKPTVLMAHYDVVPANEEQWDKPAFEGIIEDGVLWGRGTLDTKGTLLGVMESVDTLIAEGFVPANDIYLSFAGDEEISGDSAPMIVDELERRGIRPELVVDEGGAVVEGMFPGVSKRCALIGVGEKGMMDLEFYIKSSGGHASAPPPHGPVGKLSQAVIDVENHPFKSRLTPPVALMYDTVGRHSTFIYRMIFSNLWLFMPLLNALCKKNGGELNAMLRTTCAFTMTQASNASNVLPPEAKVVANMRLIGGDSTESAVEYIRGIIKNDEIELRKMHGINPSIASDTSSEGYAKLKLAIQQTWGDAIVSPYLMVACTDSRHFCRISDKVMRFSAMELTKEERGMIHGHNERIPLDKIITTVAFYIRLVKQL